MLSTSIPFRLRSGIMKNTVSLLEKEARKLLITCEQIRRIKTLKRM